MKPLSLKYQRMNINTPIESKALVMSGTQAKKLELLEWLAALQDKSLIDELAQWKAARQRTSIEAYNQDIEAADAEIEAGDYTSHEEAVKTIRSWREQ